MAILDIFVGVPQSQYAGMAILMSLIAVSVAILIGRDSMQISQKFAFVMLIFLVSAPGVLMTLFQLTCMVTGDKRHGGSWWCGAYSWLVSALVVVYSVLLVTIAVISLATSGKVLEDITRADVEKFEQKQAVANKQASDSFKDTFTDAPPPAAVKKPFTDAPPSAAQKPAPAPAPASASTGVAGIDPSQVDLMPVDASAPTPAPVPVPTAAPKPQPAYGGGHVEAFSDQDDKFSAF